MNQDLFQGATTHRALARQPIGPVLLTVVLTVVFGRTLTLTVVSLRRGTWWRAEACTTTIRQRPTGSTPAAKLHNPPGGCGNAIQDGTYPSVWNNDSVDRSFGIRAKIFLDQITASGSLVSTLEVPNRSQNGVPATKDQMVTSFSSKSELALNLSLDHQYLTFMGYFAPIDAIDVSNSNTPGAVDPTNPVPGTAGFPGCRASRSEGQAQVHRDQRIQRQQWTCGHFEQR